MAAISQYVNMHIKSRNIQMKSMFVNLSMDS